jgi:hypothetical protein
MKEGACVAPLPQSLASAAFLTIAAAIALAFLATLIFVLAGPPQMLAITVTPAAFLTIAAAIAFAFLAKLILVLAPPAQVLAIPPLN